MIFLLEYHSGLSEVGKAWNLRKKKEDQYENDIRKEDNEKSLYYVMNSFCFEHDMDLVMATLTFL